MSICGFLFRPVSNSLFSIQRVEAEEDTYYIPLEDSQLQAFQLHEASQLEDAATQVDLTPAVTTPAPSSSRKRQRSESVDENELVKKALLYMTKATEGREMHQRNERQQQRETDRYSIFGQYVACELKEIGDADLERWARQQITTILCQAQSGNLPANSNHSNQNHIVQNHSYFSGPFFRSAPCLELSDSSRPGTPCAGDHAEQ